MRDAWLKRLSEVLIKPNASHMAPLFAKSLAVRLTKFMLMPDVQESIKLSGKIKVSAEPSGFMLLCYRLQIEQQYI